MKHTLYYLFALILLGACKKEVATFIAPLAPQKSNSKDIQSAVIYYGSDSVKATVKDTLIVANIPTETDQRGTAKIKFTHNASQLYAVGDSSLTHEVRYAAIAEDGSVKYYSVKLTTFNAIPILSFWPASNIADRETYIETAYKFGNDSGKTTMRGRGNSTWGYQLPTGQYRNSYKIKFADKFSFFGYPADKEWAILANVYDKTLLRNEGYFWLSEQVRGKEWTPRHQAVDVFLWGQYAGNYLLIETIKEGKDGVNIDTKNGGWMVEFNSKPEDGDPRFYIGSGGNILPVDLKEGKDADKAKGDIQAWYDDIEHYKFGGYDVKSFASGFLVNEIFANNDAGFFSSVYLTKASNSDPIKFGPVWDADLSSGNVGKNVNMNAQFDPQGWSLPSANIWQYIKNDPAFKDELKRLWNAERTKIMALPDHIASQKQYIDLSASATFKKFGILNHLLINNDIVRGGYNQEVEYLKTWLTARINWMDVAIQKF